MSFERKTNSEEIFKRFSTLLDYSQKKGSLPADVYDNWARKDYNNENMDTEDEEERNTNKKFDRNIKTYCKFCSKFQLGRNLPQHLCSCLGVQVFNYFLKRDNPGRTQCECGKIFLKRDSKQHKCKKEKNVLIDCSYCKFNYSNHAKCEVRDIVTFLELNLKDFANKIILGDVINLAKFFHREIKEPSSKPSRRIYFTDEEYQKDNSDTLFKLNARDKFKKLQTDSNRRWYSYKGFYGPMKFLKENKFMIDKLFNAALLKEHNSMLKSCGFTKVKRPARKVYSFNSLKLKRKAKKKSLTLREEIEFEPDNYEHNQNKRVALLKDYKMDFPTMFSGLPKPTIEEYDEFLKWKSSFSSQCPIKETKSVKLYPIKIEAKENKIYDKVNLDIEHPYKIIHSCELKKTIVESFWQKEINGKKIEHNNEIQNLQMKFFNKHEVNDESDFLMGILKSFSEEDILNAYGAEKIKNWKEKQKICREIENNLNQEFNLKLKEKKNDFKKKLNKLKTLSDDELIRTNEIDYNIRMRIEKDEKITSIVKKLVLDHKLRRKEINNSGIPNNLKEIPWQGTFKRQFSDFKSSRKGINSILKASNRHITTIIKPIKKESQNTTSDKIISKLNWNFNFVKNCFVEPINIEEEDQKLKKKHKLKQLAKRFYKRQCLETSPLEDEILVPASPSR